MDTAFAKIVDTPMGEAISIEGSIIFIQAPDGRHSEVVRAIVSGLRRQGGEMRVTSNLAQSV